MESSNSRLVEHFDWIGNEIILSCLNIPFFQSHSYSYLPVVPRTFEDFPNTGGASSEKGASYYLMNNVGVLFLVFFVCIA